MSELKATLSKPSRRRLPAGLFDTRPNTIITLSCLIAAAALLTPMWHWAISDAVWSGNAQDCAAEGVGACWIFIANKLRFIIFGFYPPALQWRPAFVLLLAGILLGITSRPRFWGLPLIAAWIVAIAFFWAMMSGTFSSHPVSTNQWGGLPITILVSLIGLTAAFPFALLLALARRSQMRLLRIIAIIFIECLRGLPLIAVLYVAMLVVPMALPPGALTDKLVRAQIGITLFVSAYLAEVVRGGLQSIPSGQSEAAYSLGLGYWRTVHLVILPQAIRAVIPAVVNLSIGIVLNTSLLAVIGISDLLNVARTAATDPAWLGYYTEAFLFAASIYFAISFGASRYSLWLEARLRARS